MNRNFKRMIAFISTISMAASTFAGYTITASAADGTVVPFEAVEGITDNGDGTFTTAIIGDMNFDGTIDVVDTWMLNNYVRMNGTNIGYIGQCYEVEEDGYTVTLVWGDVNGDAKVGALDIAYLSRALAGYTAKIGNVGNEVQIQGELPDALAANIIEGSVYTEQNIDLSEDILTIDFYYDGMDNIAGAQMSIDFNTEFDGEISFTPDSSINAIVKQNSQGPYNENNPFRFIYILPYDAENNGNHIGTLTLKNINDVDDLELYLSDMKLIDNDLNEVYIPDLSLTDEPEPVALEKCGDDVTYVFDEVSGTLTISGTGPMWDFTDDNSPFYNNNEIKNVIIENGVTSIGNAMFRECAGITILSIPDSVTSIGEFAFRGCGNLMNVTIPQSVTSIGDQAFRGCTSMTTFTFPESVTSVNYAVLYGCTGLKSVTIPDSVTSIGDYAFRNCTGLTGITIPNSVTTLGKSSFSGCTGFTSVTIPNSVTTIGDSAFYGCKGLTSVTIPNSVTTIGETAFYNCTGLTGIDIPNSVTSMGDAVFYGCSKLTSIVIPNSITSISDWTFYNCISLRSVTIPDSVTSIGETVFYGCKALTSIAIPGNVTSIGKSAFNGCTGLESVTIPDSVTSLGEYAFSGCTGLTSVTISDSLTIINKSTFSGCTGLTSVTIPDSVITIGDYAFYGCAGLESITIPDSVTSLGYAAFYGCTGLTGITIPGSVTSIGEYAFDRCTGLTSIEIPDSVTSIGKYAFYGCTGLTSVTISDSITVISESLFRECTGLTNVSIPENVTSIDGGAFYGCAGLTSIAIPGSVTSIGNSAFYGCSALADVEYNGTRSDWKNIDIAEANDALTTAAIHYYAEPTAPPTMPPTPTPTPHVHSYGDWETIQSATIFSEGIEARTCAACGKTESRTTPKLTKDDDEGYGKVSFTVVDATNTSIPIKGANIFVSTESDGEGTFTTDSEGKATATLPVGKIKATVYASGYLAREIVINVTGGEQELPLLGISTKPLVEATLSHHEMTYEEIEEAGIDVEATENNQVFKSEIKIDFVTIQTYWVETPEDSSPRLVLPTPGGGSGGGGIGGGGTGGGASSPIVIYPPSAPDKPFIRIPRPDGVNIDVYPISEEFYMIVYGEVGWLKEMHEVEMLVLNNSTTDTVEECVAELKLPDGLSLAAMNGEAQTLKRTIGHIDESGSADLHWYVRGDAEGEYDIEASLTGILKPFDEEFSYNYKTGTPIKVYAGTDMQMTVKAPGYTYTNDDYVIKIELENVSNRTIYNLKHAVTGLSQTQVTIYSDGSVEKQVYVDEGAVEEISTDEFKPGDKMVIEITTNVMFQSKLIEYLLDHSTEYEAELIKLINTINAYNKLTATASSFADVIVSAGSAIGDSAATAANARLSNSLAGLGEALASDDVSKILASRILKNSRYYPMLADIANGGDVSSYSDTDKRACAVLADEIANGYCVRDSFFPYRSVRTAIMCMPVRYALQSVTISTLEGSTAEIPCTFEIDQTSGSRYFGVENLSGYYRNLIVSYMRDLDVPTSIGLGNFNVPEDDTERIVKATKNSISEFAAESATGNTSFKAWIEPANSDIAPTEAFVISSTNETAAVDSDGVLTFTGAGYIEIIPNTDDGGILNIEMTEGDDTKLVQYDIEVVPEHECQGGEWKIITAPNADEKGYRIRYCDVCGDVTDIESFDCCEEHSFGDQTVIKDATQEEDGLKVKTCDVCGYEEYELIPCSGTPTSEPTEEPEPTPTPETPTETPVDDITYTLDDDGTLTIRGTGAMDDYSGSNSPFYNNSSIKTVIIEDGITSIGSFAFFACSNLTSVKMPAGVTSVGDWAFSYCRALTDVEYGSNEADWNRISIGSGNACLKNATILYNMNCPYIINSLSIQSEMGEALDAAPQGSAFVAKVRLTKTEERSGEDYLFVAVYNKKGKLLSIDYVQADFVKDMPFSFGFHVPAQTSEIGKVKAFVWNSFTSGEPLANSQSLTW